MEKIKKNQLQLIDITDWTKKGIARGYLNGFPVLVPNTLPGEQIEALITKVTETHAYAKLLAIVQESKDRVTPACNIAYQCGGCQLQHVSQDQQITYKTSLLKQAFEQHNLSFPKTHIHKMSAPFHYRNKAHYSIEKKQNKTTAIGLCAPRSQLVIDIPTCAIQHPLSNKALNILRKIINTYPTSIFSEKAKSAGLSGIVTRVGVNTNELMVILSTNNAQLIDQKTIISKLKEIPELKSIILNTNTNPSWTLLGQKNQVIWGKESITEKIKDFSFTIGPNTFFQANPYQTEVMWDIVSKILDKKPNQTIYDLYCGTGSMSIYLAKKLKKVIGIESQKESIEIATQNAITNNVTNIEFIQGNVETIFPKMKEPCNTVIVDPPRTGLNKEIIDSLIQKKPKDIIYISCNPVSLARDLESLVNSGYQYKEMHIIDQFAQTYHVETIICLTNPKFE
jgi:23S rRNA (uracil1939-C5)-methyltransferase